MATHPIEPGVTDLESVPPGAAAFFAFARERHAVYLRRQAGQAWPWTEDPVLRQYSFCNLFRENDRTTKWLRDYVREPLRARPEVLLAVTLFRWFNRTTTGEAIFRQGSLIGHDAWNQFLETGNTDFLRSAILQYVGPKGPYVTGAYTIVGKTGLPKLDGVLWCVDNFAKGEFGTDMFAGYVQQGVWTTGWRALVDTMLACAGTESQFTLEETWRWLRQVPYLGDFMAYEIVTDLRHTALLEHAPDVQTWANPGPGAARGLARVYGREIRGNVTCGVLPNKAEMILEMQALLALSKLPEYWPQWHMPIVSVTPHTNYQGENWCRGYKLEPQESRLRHDSWPRWEMREVEHWLCEFQKYRKAQLGEGRPRGVYHHA